MRRSIICCAVSVALASFISGSARAADVHIGINVGVPPPPPIVVESPPQLVVVPSTPAVQYAPDVGANLFFYRGRYYRFHEGAWFMAPVYSGPWAYVPEPRVPRPILVVPARYYHVPPGHWRKDHGRPHERHHEHHDRDEHHGHGHGHHHD